MRRVFSKPLVRYWLPALIMLALIRLESTAFFAGGATERWLAHLLRLNPFGALAEELNFLLRKAGHCVGYALLSFLAFRAMRGTYLYLQFGFAGWRSSRAYEPMRLMGRRALWQWPWALVGFFTAAATGVLDEIHQMYVPGRTGTLQDMALDSSAALVAQILTYFTAIWIARRRRGRVSS